MQKYSAQNPAFSRGRSDADDGILSTVSSGHEDGVLVCAKTANRSKAMARCIERHRRLLIAVSRLSRKKITKRWTPSATVAWLGLTVGRMLERSARRRLIQLKAVDSCEAEQKILYLVATSMTHEMVLEPAEIPEITASVEPFRTDVTDLLRSS